MMQFGVGERGSVWFRNRYSIAETVSRRPHGRRDGLDRAVQPCPSPAVTG
jgi:hypothetical protein